MVIRKPDEPERVRVREHFARIRFIGSLMIKLRQLPPSEISRVARLCGWKRPPYPLTRATKREEQRAWIADVCFKDRELRAAVERALDLFIRGS
jgi:hypothetical protein